MDKPEQSHLVAAKRVLRYLKGTNDYGVLFPIQTGRSNHQLIGYSDSDWCGDKVDRRSTSGYVFKFMNAVISWSSKKQNIVALSSCEAEYVSASDAAQQMLWLESLLDELKVGYVKPVQLLVDNKSAISLAKNPVAHGRSKHIETRFHFIRDQVNKKKLELVYCTTEDQLADVFTKPLRVERFEKLRDMLGVFSVDVCIKGEC